MDYVGLRSSNILVVSPAPAHNIRRFFTALSNPTVPYFFFAGDRRLKEPQALSLFFTTHS
jgi:hypothetical protein